MKLIATRHLWGITTPWEELFPRIAEAGFTAIETPIQWLSPDDAKRLQQQLAKHNFAFIPQCFTEGKTPQEHAASFRNCLEKCAPFNPLLVNFQSGRDAWTTNQAIDFFGAARHIETELGIAVGHETHRSRTFYSPWITQEILKNIPDLHITVDFSHWVCVAERLVLDEEPEILDFMANRAIHIHARVGYNEGPQVPDPRAPEYVPEVEAHDRWWHVVWQHMAKRGLTHCTVTPEYGPGRYMHHLPHTDVPVANLWDVCSWQMEHVRQQFAKRQ